MPAGRPRKSDKAGLAELRADKLRVRELIIRNDGNMLRVVRDLNTYGKTLDRLIQEDEDLKKTVEKARAGGFSMKSVEELREVSADVAEAVMKHRGNMITCARELNTNRHTLVAFLEEDQDLNKIASDLREGRIDEVEDKAFEKALRGDNSMIRLILLSTPEGKRRGWIERPSDDPIRHKTEITINLHTPWGVEGKEDQGEVVEAEVVKEIESADRD